MYFASSNLIATDVSSTSNTIVSFVGDIFSIDTCVPCMSPNE
jgi:hypothetical protein